MSHADAALRFTRFLSWHDGPMSDPCWVWTGTYAPRRQKHRYGRFSVAGTMYFAHRWIYEAINGAIPPGMTIDHLCRVTLCCNPAHLEVVTMWENTKRGDGPTAQKAKLTHCRNGHPFDSVHTRTNGATYRYCMRCRMARQQQRRAALAALRGKETTDGRG